MNNIFSHNFNYFLIKNKNNLLNKFYSKNILILKVLQIKKKFIILDGNLKSECILRTKEFLEKNILKIKEGNYIEVFLKNIENNLGRVLVSYFKLKKYIFLKKIYISYKNKSFIKGILISKIKGGYLVSIKGMRCFLPFSCSDKKLLNINYYLKKELYFYILNFDIFKKNVILSRKFIIFKILKLKKKVFFKNIKKGFIVKGVIRNITNYCVFIDIGYLDCIFFFKDLIWGNYRYFNEFLKVGQSIFGIVLKIDNNKKRIFLGLKQIFNPWKKILKLKNFIKYSRILRLTSNKIYISIGKNIISSIYNIFNKNVTKYFKINDYIKIKILNFNFKRKRITFKFIPSLAQ